MLLLQLVLLLLLRRLLFSRPRLLQLLLLHKS